jgi:hypothetical protein
MGFKNMKKSLLLKMFVLTVAVLIGSVGFFFSYKSEMQAVNLSNTPEKIFDATPEIADYKSWTKVNEKPSVVSSAISMQCVRPTQAQMDLDATNPHNDKFINVYVNAVGKDEMITKQTPKFPVGTVIVKEKLTTAESKEPELLTVMIKREKDYNREVGDWEFLTFNGAGTETTARGKLESCQTCHLVEKRTDYISRRYLPYAVWQKLK